jgi:phosphoribosylglycinamide formyltransferase-1
MKYIAIFASGGGSNAACILKYFENHKDVRVSLVITNVENAGVIKHALEYNIPYEYVKKSKLTDEEGILTLLNRYKVDYIVLAGFLLLIPDYLVKAYPRKILNIHPSLLPKYGGKGMYGINVHTAVKNGKETESGMTIHLVNEKYDEGDIVFQAKCNIDIHDTVEEIASKVLRLEHKHYASMIETYIRQNESIDNK